MIVSIYLQEHEYLTNSPQTFNFGGEYLYSFNEDKKDLIVERTVNEKYIPDFFDSGSECKVELLSAIVGENGIGKSSVLDIIRSVFVENSCSMPHHLSAILVEENGETKVLKSNFKNIYLVEEKSKIALETISKDVYQTIYYSPHFDLKYSNNFSEVDKYDISLDNFVKKDLENTDKKGTDENGWRFGLNEELLLNNAMRQLEFLNSKIYKDSDVFRQVFNIPNYEDGILYFRDINLQYDSDDTIRFSNTPSQLRPIINTIFDKLEKENKNRHKYRDSLTEKDKDKKQALVNKYLLKRFVVKAYLSLIINQMEKSSDWLDKGYIQESYNVKKFDKSTALDVFKYFIKESKIKNNGRSSEHIFNAKEVFSLLDKLKNLIEKENDSNKKVGEKKIEVKVSEISEILKLHKKVITQLFYYYPKNGNNLIDKSNYTEGFITFRPTDKSLSSGENAFLNFYSRLYHFIDNNLVEERKSLPDKKKYVLLLDEADLGFHPMWKKKFVDTMLKSVPHFFENLDSKPHLQIIITTHDPFTLSDVPNNNVTFLKKEDNFCSVISEKETIMRTFGANISNLLSHSFFVEDGLIGDFSKSKINEVIAWINKHKDIPEEKRDGNFKEELEYYKKIINLIDEKIIRLKLTEMITDLIGDDDYYNEMIDKEIQRLKNKKR